MKKIFSNEKALSVTLNRFDKSLKTNNKTINPSHIQSTVGSNNRSHSPNSLQSISLDNIYTIINLHYPNYFTSQHHKLTINTHNYQQILNGFLKDIKQEHHKQIQQVQDQFRSVEMELKLVRDSRDDGIQKIKMLENEIVGQNQKLKSKQFDCYAKNQEIFLIKQKIQNLQKQLVLKNLEVTECEQQFQIFKNQAYSQIQKYRNLNKILKIQNKKLQQKVFHLETQIQKNQLQHERQKHILKQSSKNSIIYNYPQTIRSQGRRNSQPFIQPPQQYFPSTFPSQQYHLPPQQYSQGPQVITTGSSFNYNSATHLTIKPKSRPLTQRSRVIQKSQFVNSHPPSTSIPQTTSELLDQVRELKQNQSALLDRLAQRDKMIQNLESQLSSSMIQP